MKTKNLTMNVNFSDNEVLITCRGNNSQYSALKYEEFVDSIKLNVLYKLKKDKPRVILSVQNVNKEDIEEEDDIYLRCQNEANPPPTFCRMDLQFVFFY
ncbi:hypothetical protein Anas_10968 [Armadillidium nasatum]|uniref:Uncharacterized protein n=1 Tax=Armadillidium nasatum TaxID=96803 RepID=A0A5N5SXM7_9CRUS|nr:hypothetical protein Anas_10968 [Armadillidium nasatum]